MYLRKIKSVVPLAALLLAALGTVSAQTQDNSQNGLLNGTYWFRHLAVQNVDTNFNPTDVTATYGTIAFDGNGNYTLTGTTVDNVATNGVSQALNVSGTYAIGSNGAGYITNPLYETDPNALIYGAVSQGVFTGSSTEAYNDGNYLNDIFVAIPGGTKPSNASFTSPYQSGLLDFTGAGSTATKNALFELTPNGSGGFGAITLNGQAANINAATVTQTTSGATYNFNSDGTATLTIPAPSRSTGSALFTGTRTLVQSADGNFILGWTPGGYDIFFGVKALTAAATNNLSLGLYFTAGLEDSPNNLGTDSFYGGTNNSGDSAGDGIVHQRLNLSGVPSYDYGTDDQTDLNSDGTTASPDFNGYSYIFGEGGNAFVAIGTNGNYSLQVGLHAAALTGPGVYLNPIGVNNAASLMPVTASVAPGELLQLSGTGLASQTILAPGNLPFPTTLGQVTVSIDGTPCPIYVVAPTVVDVEVPYEVASNQSGLANIQVTNNGAASNVVQVYLTDAEPGTFSQGADGIGYAAALHPQQTGAPEITPSNPVQPNEVISLYLTGLGTVTPTIPDGAVGPSSPLSYSDLFNSGNLSVYFNDYTSGGVGIPGTVTFAGLTPTEGGLYQINVQVPAASAVSTSSGAGLASGDNVYVEITTDAADIDEIQVPYGAGAVTPDVVPVAARREAAKVAHARAMRTRTKPARRRARTTPAVTVSTNR